MTPIFSRCQSAARRPVGGLAAFAILSLLLGLPLGCANSPEEQPEEAPPEATYTGPDYLRGTVGSLTRIQNYQYMPVSGYGLVVGLDGTGSESVPSFLEDRMTNRLRKMGVGSARHDGDLADITPEELLARRSTAVVAVRGFIPPGASAGTRFDVVVSALQETQTTSLVGGRLYTTELGRGGLDPSLGYTTPLAKANGDIYVNPFDKESSRQQEDEFVFHAMVVAGAEATRSRSIQLVLNQASWTRSRDIADRINERFPTRPGADRETAEAQNDMLIELNVPRQFQSDPSRFVELVNHLYTQRSPGFDTQKAQQLVELLKEDPERADRIALAWRALGRPVVPELRQYYEAEPMELRFAALEAGAWLEDERTSRYLHELAQHEDADLRQKAARALVPLPSDFQGSRAIERLLDDSDRDVRLSTYEALAAVNDATLDRLAVKDRQGETKFIIDRVPAENPLVYITQEGGTPRLAIFKPDLGFAGSNLASVWDRDLMLRIETPQEKITARYSPPRGPEGETYDLEPTVATLAYFLAHEPTMDRPQDGLGLSYSKTVDAIYQLCEDGAIPAPVEVRTSELAEQLDEIERVNPHNPEQTPGPTNEAPPADEGEQMPANEAPMPEPEPGQPAPKQEGEPQPVPNAADRPAPSPQSPARGPGGRATGG
jgi:hypothetical protein